MRGFVFASLFVVGCGGGEFQATGGDDAGDEGDASIGADADAAAQDGSAQDVAQDAASSDSSSGDAATCAPPMTLCTNGSTSVCTDLSSDDKNCHACKNVCPAGSSCKASQCVCADASKTLCGSACVDTTTDPTNCGGCGTPCVNANCAQGQCDRIVFVTTSVYSTGFAANKTSPVGVADQLCATAATGAGLPGTYMAWISDAATSPNVHFATKSLRHYALTDGTIVASDWTGLTSGTLLHAIDKDQNRAVVTAGIVMTNTGTSGQRWTTTEDCGVWTAAVANTTFFMEGSTGGTDHTWTTPATETPCGGSYHLYCFQQ